MTFDANAISAYGFPVAGPLTSLSFSIREAEEIHILEETQADVFARENLLDEAFGPARFKKTCVRLRDGRLPARGLALAAKSSGGELAGTLRLWHIKAGKADALLLGPLAVAESRRGLGLGRKLIGEALFRAVCFGHKAVLLVGDAPYYSAFGFDRNLTKNLNLPGPVDPNRFLGLELHEGALAGAEGLVTASGAIDPSKYLWRNGSLRAA